MALHINRIPVPRAERSIKLPTGDTIALKSLQPIVWISVAPPQVIDLPPTAPRFPAVIDTGFNQTLLIQDWHLEKWAGVKSADLQVFPGEAARYGNQTWPFRLADIWLQPADLGANLPVVDSEAFCLETHPGILVVRESERRQRLPVLGMRALAWNRVRLTLEFDDPATGWLSLESLSS